MPDIKQRALKGDDEAMVIFGKILIETKQSQAGIEMLRRATETGNNSAMVNLSQIYMAQKIYQKSFYWSEKAAESGSIAGRYNLALHYYYGLGVKQDKIRAKNIMAVLSHKGYREAKETYKKWDKE